MKRTQPQSQRGHLLALQSRHSERLELPKATYDCLQMTVLRRMMIAPWISSLQATEMSYLLSCDMPKCIIVHRYTLNVTQQRFDIRTSSHKESKATSILILSCSLLMLIVDWKVVRKHLIFAICTVSPCLQLVWVQVECRRCLAERRMLSSPCFNSILGDLSPRFVYLVTRPQAVPHTLGKHFISLNWRPYPYEYPLLGTTPVEYARQTAQALSLSAANSGSPRRATFSHHLLQLAHKSRRGKPEPCHDLGLFLGLSGVYYLVHIAVWQMIQAVPSLQLR